MLHAYGLFPAFSDGVFYTEIRWEKHVRLHTSLKISVLPKQAAEYE